MKKAQIGSVFSANEAGCDVALQLICRNKVIGDIARVCRLHELSSNICDKMETLFIIGFPFAVAIKDGYLKYIADCPVPERLQEIKFRFPNASSGKKIASWTILSDDGQQIVKSLNHEQLTYPLAYAVNIQKLEELIAGAWNGKEPIS